MKQSIPKLSAPRPRNVVRRTALIARLDDAASAVVTWIAGAPGIGKTTAIADYIAFRKHRAAWINIDSEDNDPPAFFHYLGMAIAGALAKYRFRFPAFAADYRDDPITYARMFFRYLARRIDVPLVVVLDDAHKVQNHAFQCILECAGVELPSSVRLIVISREQPSPGWVRAYTHRRLDLVDADQLSFSLDESRALLERDGNISADAVRRIHEHAQGWVTGLILLREMHCRRQLQSLDDSLRLRVADPELLSGYFAEEIFSGAEPSLRRLWRLTAYLPFVTLPIAQALDPEADAAALFETLCRRNLFTYRISRSPATFQYHPLFQQFLRGRANAEFSLEERRHLQRRCAELLFDANHTEAAIELFLEGECYSGAAIAILAVAPEFQRQGRHNTLIGWFEALAPTVLQTNAWLLFRLGEAYIEIDRVKARAHLEQAYEKFCQATDRFGQAFAAATILEAMQWGETTYHNIEKWAEVIRALYGEHLERQPTEALQIATGRLLADTLLGRGDPSTREVAEAMKQLLVLDIDNHRRVRAAIVLLGYYIVVMDRCAARELAALVAPLATSHDVSAAQHSMWLNVWGYFQGFTEGDWDQANALWLKAERIAVQAGLTRQWFASRLYQAERAFDAGDDDAATQLLSSLETSTGKAGSLYCIAYHHTLARLSLSRERVHDSLRHARAALRHCEEIALPATLRVVYQIDHLLAAAVKGHGREIDDLLACVADQAIERPAIACLIKLVRAFVATEQEQTEEAIGLLRSGLIAARELDYPILARLPKSIAAPLCRLAFDKNIECDFVGKITASRDLVAPEAHWKNWPWRVRIYCLGRFQVVVDGISVNDSKASSPRTMQLLRILVALGGAAPSDLLIDMLWPGDGRAGTKNALDSAVHRLRKLLRDDKSVNVKESTVMLNRHLVWADAWALEALIDRIGNGRNERHSKVSLCQHRSEIFALYGGHIHIRPLRHPELLTAKERLWGKVRQVLLRLAKHHESDGSLEEANQIYRFGMQHDPLAAEFPYALMRSLLRENREVEALSVYSMHAQSVRMLLNREPAGALQTLADTLTVRSTSNRPASSG